MKKVLDFLKSYQFHKGLVISASAFIAVLITQTFFDISIGIAMAFGILMVSTSDIPGLPSQRLPGMFMALILGIFNYLMIQWAKEQLWLLYPVAAFCVFLSSYVAIYGFRASLASFSSLLGIAISYVHQAPDGELWLYAFYILLGGLWYIGLTRLVDMLTPPVLRDELMNRCIYETAELIRENLQLIENPKDTSFRQKMNVLQLSLTELHEQLRNELLTREEILGTGGVQRKELLITAELIDIFEMVVAQLPHQHHEGPAKESYRAAVSTIYRYLDLSRSRLLALTGVNPAESDEGNAREALRKASEDSITAFRSEISISEYTEDLLFLRNLNDYARETDEKVSSIERLVYESGGGSPSRKITDKELLITRQTYDWRMLKEQFSLRSPILRHALRLVFATLLALFVGQFFEIPKTYWILLTLFVLMRPSYALTKQRSVQRVIGTLVGAAIAFILVYISRDMVFLMSMTFISLALTFTFMQQNYRTAAMFVTIAMILIYVLTTPDTIGLIQDRIADTLIGAGIAVFSNKLIFPYWEYSQVTTFIKNFTLAQKNYIQKIHEHYRDKTGKDTHYLLARKNSFLMMAQLNSAFQRQLQEPKSRQKGIGRLQELLSTAQAMLSATAALGTYIHIHQTTEISVHFEAYIGHILYNLDRAADLIEGHKKPAEVPSMAIDEARRGMEVHYHLLKKQLRRMEAKGDTAYRPAFSETMKEARIISEQLEWIYQLSQRFYTDLQEYLDLRDTTSGE